MRKIYWLSAFLFVFTFASCRKDLNPGQGIPDLTGGTQSNNGVLNLTDAEFVPNEVIVKFKAGASETGRANALSRIGGKTRERILTAAMKRAGDDEGVFVLETARGVMEAIGALKSHVDVLFAEPNFIYKHTYESNDNCYLRLPGTSTNLWGMYSNDMPSVGPTDSEDGSIKGFLTKSEFGSWAEKAWAKGFVGSSNVVVGVIDEGMYWNHDDFKQADGTTLNIQNPNPNTIYPSLNKDPYPDDNYGWNFVNNDNKVYTPGQDQHGTHVAGTIGAVGGNSIAVAGICWNVKIISAKFLGPNGGTTSNAIKAVDYFTDLKTQLGLNIVATNNSWGGGGYSQALYDAIQRANNKGILFVAAAGNSGINIDNRKSYPASYTNANVVAVAAINSAGNVPNWSNYGAKTVHLGAPGEWIYSTYPPSDVATGYHPLSGTSMATPHVTGAIALYAAKLALSPTSATDALNIKNQLLASATATPTSSLARKTITGGRLNVSRFLGLEP